MIAKKLIAQILLIATPMMSFGQITLPQERGTLEGLGFFPSEVFEDIGPVTGAIDAMLASFKFPVDPQGHGTGFFTSKLGHFITNIHVVKRCLFEQSFIDRLENGNYERTSKPFPANCKVTQNSHTFEFEILASGLGFTEQGNLELMRGDFVLGRVLRGGPEVQKCIQVTDLPPSQNDRIHIVGYPMASEQRASNSDGVRQQISSGRLVLEQDLVTCAVISHSQYGLPQQQKNVSRQERPHFFPGMYSVTSDVLNGNSGGPAVINNKVIGIVESISANVQSASQYCPGASYLIPMTHILNELKVKLSSETFHAAFDCAK